MEALSRSRLNKASTSAFVKNMVGSSRRLASRLAANKLSALIGVVSWMGSSRTGSRTGGARVELGLE